MPARVGSFATWLLAFAWFPVGSTPFKGVAQAAPLSVNPQALAPSCTQGVQAPRPENQRILLSGLFQRPGSFTLQDAKSLPRASLVVSYRSHGQGQTHHFVGVRLWDVLQWAGLQLSPEHKNDVLRKCLIVRAKDGYTVVFGLGEIHPSFAARPYLLAWQKDGRPLEEPEGPFRIAVPGDLCGGRNVYGVVSLEVKEP
jgi:DMSO/TMAO reductase YedYZ molybdopterin-dependent catalytic subunit